MYYFLYDLKKDLLPSALKAFCIGAFIVMHNWGHVLAYILNLGLQITI